MSAKSTKTKSPRTRTNWRKLKAMNDRDIDFSDIPETDKNFWAKARVVMPPVKTHLSLRLDEDVVEWFKRKGSGYQTRMNAVLRAYVRHQVKANGND
jgi:uncharacterized protein (DUF4415 family)